MQSNSIAKNSTFFVVYRLANVVFPLLIVMYASNVLLASGIGKIASAQNIVQYFSLIAALGIPNYGIREVARVKDCQEEVNHLFSELFTLNFFSTLLCSVCFYMLIGCTTISRGEHALYCVTGLSIILNFFNVDWFYQGFEEYAYILKRSFAIKMISFVAIFVFVKDASDYVTYAFIYLFGIAGNNLVNFVHLRKYNVHFSIYNLNLKKHLKPVFVLLGTTFAIELYTMVDTTMLTYMCSEETVGFYSNSLKIVKTVITLVTAIGGVLLPRLSYYYSRNEITKCTDVVNKVVYVLLFLLIPSGIGNFLIADYLVPVVFGASFLGAVPTLKIASLLVYTLGFSNLFGTQVLLTFNDEKHLLISTALGAILNIMMNSILIPLYQQNGAIISSVVSEALVTMMTYRFACRFIYINVQRSFIWKTIFAGIGMGLCIYSFSYFSTTNFTCVIGMPAIGIISYGAISYILKNDVISLFLELKKRKRKH